MYKRKKITARKGYTLMEICIAMVIICILVSISAPLYSRAVEQARLDSAAGNLISVWSAQRVYWLKYHTFASTLTALSDEDLISSQLAETQLSSSAMYVYNIDSANSISFVATAARSNSRVWGGEIQIDESGQLSGSITNSDGLALNAQPLE